jgi:hypothetical protein
MVLPLLSRLCSIYGHFMVLAAHDSWFLSFLGPVWFVMCSVFMFPFMVHGFLLPFMVHGFLLPFMVHVFGRGT